MNNIPKILLADLEQGDSSISSIEHRLNMPRETIQEELDTLALTGEVEWYCLDGVKDIVVYRLPLSPAVRPASS